MMGFSGRVRSATNSPPEKETIMSYSHLTEKERYVISHLRIAKFSLREIARRLGRHHTSISREIKRNRPGYMLDSVYWYSCAQPIADRRRHMARSYRRQNHPPLVGYVDNKLQLDWPPEAIAARLKIDYPGDRLMRISAETIYRWVYLDARQGGDLRSHLRRRHPKRRQQKRYGSGRRFIPGRVSIDQRPAIVATRERLGDWEGDTVEGAKGTGALATHVERKSRYLVAVKLADKKAATMNAQSIEAFLKLPEHIRLTLTVDNGREFSRFKELEAETGLSVYFADPYAAWQRGTNENTNGLLRFYFPKGMNFQEVTDEELEAAVERINHRPRKCLNYQTPHEFLVQNLSGALAI
jgi:IS30 family transposase